MNQIGIDISKRVFDVVMDHASGVVHRQFPNTKTGHRHFMKWCLRQGVFNA